MTRPPAPPRRKDAGSATPGPTVWTIGHSTRPLDDFTRVLQAHGVELITDVRRFPGSRRLPQYSHPALPAGLAEAGIGYHWIEALGGRRRPDPRSPHGGWRHAAFRGYADHAWTAEFAGGLGALLDLALGLRTAVMCSEILWWRCHRRLIADVLTSLGGRVFHIRDVGAPELHRLSPPAHLLNGHLSYAPAESGKGPAEAGSRSQS